MKRKPLIVSCLTGLIMALLAGCAATQSNVKQNDWEIATASPVADPNIKTVSAPIEGRGSYWSVLYLFAVYEVDDEYKGFDILNIIDFTPTYKSDNIIHEKYYDSKMDEKEEVKLYLDMIVHFFFKSRDKRLKNLVVNKMCVNSDYDVVLSPIYRLENHDIPILWQTGDMKVKAYAGKIDGFTVRGRAVGDAYFPNEENGPRTFFPIKKK